MKKWLFIFICALALVSCEKNEDNLLPNQEKRIVLKERDPNYPWTLGKDRFFQERHPLLSD